MGMYRNHLVESDKKIKEKINQFIGVYTSTSILSSLLKDNTSLPVGLVNLIKNGINRATEEDEKELKEKVVKGGFK